jgi:23S rRNA (uracil1939-C5)-methyltransferase
MRRKARPGGGRHLEVRVEALGARGDGLARHEGRPLYVAQTLPGDLVRVRLAGKRAGGFRGDVLELLEEGPGRVVPPCPFFGSCGGCSLQHFAPERYLDWKQGLLAKVMARQAFTEAELRPLISIEPGQRRRIGLAYRRTPGALRLGFHGRQSHDVVKIDSCLLMTPGLQALLPALKALLTPMTAPGAGGHIDLLEAENGIDLLLCGPPRLDLAAREALAAFAEAYDLARLTWQPPEGEPEPLALRRAPQVLFAGVAVTPPPGGFLQPSTAGEAALATALQGFLPASAKRAADLFCGCGTFTFALAAAGLSVLAVEGDGPALSALTQAARAAGLAARIATEERDLARRPLSVEELNAFDLVVFDPPRAGAREQAAALSQAGVATVIAVSCNPATFGRDAALLRDGGYRLEAVQPVDQFPFTGHLELVARFRKGT